MSHTQGVNEGIDRHTVHTDPMRAELIHMQSFIDGTLISDVDKPKLQFNELTVKGL